MPATTRSKSKQSHLEDLGVKEPKSKNAKDKQQLPQSKTSRSKAPDSKKRTSSPSPSESKSRSKKRKSSSSSTTSAASSSSPPSSKKSRQGQRGDKSSGSSPDTARNKNNNTAKDEDTGNDKDKEEDTIPINRSPVLQLWSACVAHHLYPQFPWTTDLAIGAAISTLCAIAKGKSIGTIEPREKTHDEEAEQSAERRAAEAGADREIQVMGFRLYVKGEDVLVQGKPRRGNEDLLKRKFGPGNYERAKKAMDDAIATWTTTATTGGGGQGGKRNDDELNSKAFHMYEEFRPSVQSGQSGWGKKGVLKLNRVREVVAR
ncbi:hypothetical protein PV08_01706 [Exophiala spinifera]|uniref:Uncharacterized protein n=1 Tax=Exophiala spinifera TaxID=91928 RepID=A0A0D1Z0J4_9EURO|nr:uncharacterized protein PV08_01706 [Exophiala spinifera]KIW21126.1 hypothetical protein PV08_01706 [Exophiala spinifera]